MIRIHTGNGKGKTTTAIGEAIRAVDQGQKVCMIQFMKGNINYGELKTVKKFKSHFIIKQFGRPSFVNKERPAKIDVKLANDALNNAKNMVSSRKWDMIILDEINVALDYKLIELDNVLKLAKSKPSNIELILTGRYAPKRILDIADLVLEFREVKHPYQKNLKPRKGIEY